MNAELARAASPVNLLLPGFRFTLFAFTAIVSGVLLAFLT
jgi:hypothetical protein